LAAELEEFAERGVDAGYASLKLQITYFSWLSILGACWSNYLVLF
jgi:hypothetical protein